MLDHNQAHRDEHVLDESLTRLAATAPALVEAAAAAGSPEADLVPSEAG